MRALCWWRWGHRSISPPLRPRCCVLVNNTAGVTLSWPTIHRHSLSLYETSKPSSSPDMGNSHCHALPGREEVDSLAFLFRMVALFRSPSTRVPLTSPKEGLEHKMGLVLKGKCSIPHGCRCKGFWELSQGSDPQVPSSHSCPNAWCLTLSPWGFLIKTEEDSQPETAAKVGQSNYS